MRLISIVFLTVTLTTSAAANMPVTPISEVQRGMQVTVSGMVERITDEDEFRLRDETGSVRVYIGPNWVPAAVGEAVIVTGFVDDDFGPLEIYARSLTRDNGQVIEFQHRYD
jgi:uncharacterized protein YdeI (BOF family)